MIVYWAWAIVDTYLNTLHEAHIDELDIPLVLSQLEAEARELRVLLDLYSPEMQWFSTDLNKEGLDDEDEDG